MIKMPPLLMVAEIVFAFVVAGYVIYFVVKRWKDGRKQ